MRPWRPSPPKPSMPRPLSVVGGQCLWQEVAGVVRAGDCPGTSCNGHGRIRRRLAEARACMRAHWPRHCAARCRAPQRRGRPLPAMQRTRGGGTPPVAGAGVFQTLVCVRLVFQIAHSNVVEAGDSLLDMCQCGLKYIAQSLKRPARVLRQQGTRATRQARASRRGGVKGSKAAV